MPSLKYEVHMKKVYLNILMSAFLFGTMEVALKLAGSDMDSFQLTFLRFMIGGVLLGPFALTEMKRRGVRLLAKDWLYLFALGIVCIPLSMLLFQLGIMRSNASTAAVLFCVNPFFTMVFAHFLSNEKLNRQKALVLVLGLTGLFFMIRPWNLQQGNSVIGVLLMLLAAALFGLYTVMGKNSIAKIGIMAQTSISFILGALALLPVILIQGRPVFEGVAEHIMMIIYIGVFVTGLGYYCYFTAIKNSDATTGSIAFFIKPAIAPVIAVIVLGDVILWNTYIGICFILAASYLNIRSRRLEKRESERKNKDEQESETE